MLRLRTDDRSECIERHFFIFGASLLRISSILDECRGNIIDSIDRACIDARDIGRGRACIVYP